MNERRGILVVEDDLANLKLMVDTLEDAGWTVRPASNGEAALAAAQAEPPELVLLDIRMPGMDGFEVCRRLKDQAALSSVPVLFLSALVSPPERVQGFALGAVDFIPKPFDRDELLARVHTHLELGRLRSQLETEVALRTRELEQSQKDLATRESRHRTMLRTATDAVLLVNSDGGLVDVNEAACKMLGYTREELLEMAVPDIEAIEHLEDTRAHMARIMREGTELFETVHRTKDNCRLEVEVSATYLPDLSQFVVYVRDNTERSRAQKALRDSEERFRLLAENSTDMISRHTPEGIYLYVSPACRNLLGYSPEELVGHSAYEFIDAEDREEVRRSHDIIIDQAVTYTVAYRFRRNDGGHVWLETTSRTLRDPRTGEVVEIHAASRDITARKQLEREREQFERFFETSADLMCIAHPDGAFMKTNPACTQVLGYSREELISKPFIEFVVPEDRQSTQDEIRKQLQTGYTVNFENRYLCKDASIKWLSWRASYDRNDGITYATARDITAQKETINALREANQRISFHTRRMPLGFICWDRDFKVTEWNPTAERIFGWSQEEAMGKHAYDLIVPEDIHSGLSLYWSHMMDGGEFDSHNVNDNVTRTGERRTCEWFNAPMTDGSGNIVGCMSLVADITERRLAEQALRESEERFATAFRFMPVGLGITTLTEGRFVSINRTYEEIFGYREDEVLGHTASEFGLWANPEDRAQVVSALEKGQPVHGLEVPICRKDGSLRWVSYSGDLVTLKGEKCLISGAVDITDLRRTEEERQLLHAELEHLQRMESVGRLAGGIAHDMNNVLTAIMAVASLLQHKGGEHLRQAALIIKACERGRDLIKNLMDFARKEVQEADFLDLNELVHREAELLSNTTMQRIKVELDLTAGLPRMMGSTIALSTALMNLCVNAVDAMPEGGTLTLRTALHDDRTIQLAVDDTGHGMPPEVLSRAMEPFYTTKPQGKGTGLGLAMVFGTIQAHGGHIEIQSQVGKGTRVLITLPVSPGERHRSPSLVPEVPRSPTAPALHILVVDDDPLVRESTPGLLEELGHRVTVANGGFEALGLVEYGAGWDVVLLDQNMPDMSGVETLRRLRRLRPELPVIMATGHADPQLRQCLSEFERLAIITKPYSLEEIQEALAKVR